MKKTMKKTMLAKKHLKKFFGLTEFKNFYFDKYIFKFQVFFSQHRFFHRFSSIFLLFTIILKIKQCYIKIVNEILSINHIKYKIIN